MDSPIREPGLDALVAVALGWRWYARPLNGGTEIRRYILPEDGLWTDEAGGWIRHNGSQTPGSHGGDSRLLEPDEIERYELFSDWWRVAHCYGPSTQRMDTPKFWGVPYYSTDPAAADLVRQEIENRRGVLMEQTAPCGDARVWFADVDIVSAQRSAQSTEGRGYALCLAFLAADQAQKESQ